MWSPDPGPRPPSPTRSPSPLPRPAVSPAYLPPDSASRGLQRGRLPGGGRGAGRGLPRGPHGSLVHPGPQAPHFPHVRGGDPQPAGSRRAHAAQAAGSRSLALAARWKQEQLWLESAILPAPAAKRQRGGRRGRRGAGLRCGGGVALLVPPWAPPRLPGQVWLIAGITQPPWDLANDGYSAGGDQGC